PPSCLGRSFDDFSQFLSHFALSQEIENRGICAQTCPPAPRVRRTAPSFSFGHAIVSRRHPSRAEWSVPRDAESRRPEERADAALWSRWPPLRAGAFLFLTSRGARQLLAQTAPPQPHPDSSKPQQRSASGPPPAELAHPARRPQLFQRQLCVK